MTNDVMLTISGFQSGGNSNEYNPDPEPVEVITPAKYYFKNGKHYLLYDETDPQDRSVTHSVLKLRENALSVSHSGDANAHLVIESDKRNVTYYATPFGSLHILLDGKRVEVEESESLITAEAFYGLEINYDHIADCEIRIRVEPRSIAFSSKEC